MTKADDSPRYRAPALEKGLDVLELLARETQPLSLSQLSERLGRSKGEIFRMMQVLEDRHYIAKRPGEDGYTLTNRLFMLGVEQPPMRGLLETSLPLMHRLAEDIWQSCHLAVPALDQIVIIARVEAPGAMGFSVRLGHRVPMMSSTSGRVLLANQPSSVLEHWKAMIRQSGGALPDDLDASLERIRKAGYLKSPSTAVKGVTDLSAPVLQAGVAVAALTVPFVDTAEARVDKDVALGRIRDTATEISNGLRFGAANGLDIGPQALEQIVARSARSHR